MKAESSSEQRDEARHGGRKREDGGSHAAKPAADFEAAQHEEQARKQKLEKKMREVRRLAKQSTQPSRLFWLTIRRDETHRFEERGAHPITSLRDAAQHTASELVGVGGVRMV